MSSQGLRPSAPYFDLPLVVHSVGVHGLVRRQVLLLGGPRILLLGGDGAGLVGQPAHRVAGDRATRRRVLLLGAVRLGGGELGVVWLLEGELRGGAACPTTPRR